jgi:hypothetical protein
VEGDLRPEGQSAPLRITAGAFTGKPALFAGMEPHDRVAGCWTLSSQLRVTLPQRHVAAI